MATENKGQNGAKMPCLAAAGFFLTCSPVESEPDQGALPGRGQRSRIHCQGGGSAWLGDHKTTERTPTPAKVNGLIIFKSKDQQDAYKTRSNDRKT